MNYKITNVTSEEAEYIDDKLVEFNLSKVYVDCDPKNLFEWFGKKITDDKGDIIAGCLANTSVWNTAEISVLWVDEAYRMKGLGTQLLKEIECEFIKKGCNIISLDTFDWQAREFYEKNGYSIFGVLNDCPQGHMRYYMKKDLYKKSSKIVAYPTIIEKDTESDGYNVTVPDIFGGVTCGDDFASSILMAKDMIKMMLLEAPGQCFPPKTLEETKANFPDKIVVMVEIDLN